MIDSTKCKLVLIKNNHVRRKLLFFRGKKHSFQNNKSLKRVVTFYLNIPDLKYSKLLKLSGTFEICNYMKEATPWPKLRKISMIDLRKVELKISSKFADYTHVFNKEFSCACWFIICVAQIDYIYLANVKQNTRQNTRR